MPVTEHMQVIVDFHRRECPGEQPAVYGPGATAEDLAAYRDAFGEDLPAQLAEALSVANGGPFFGCELLSVERVIAERRMWDGIVDDFAGEDGDLESEHPDAVSGRYVKVGWVPFVADGGGNGLAIDTVPEPNGTVGQVINYGADEHTRRLHATSLEGWLARLVQSIEAGAVQFDGPYTAHFTDVGPDAWLHDIRAEV